MTDADKERLAQKIIDRGANTGLDRYPGSGSIVCNLYEGWRDGLNDAARIIREQPTESPWISVEERLPEEGHAFLAWRKGKIMLVNGSDAGLFLRRMADDGFGVTHWSPIAVPQAPPHGSA